MCCCSRNRSAHWFTAEVAEHTNKKFRKFTHKNSVGCDTLTQVQQLINRATVDVGSRAEVRHGLEEPVSMYTEVVSKSQANVKSDDVKGTTPSLCKAKGEITIERAVKGSGTELHSMTCLKNVSADEMEDLSVMTPGWKGPMSM